MYYDGINRLSSFADLHVLNSRSYLLGSSPSMHLHSSSTFLTVLLTLSINQPLPVIHSGPLLRSRAVLIPSPLKLTILERLQTRLRDIGPGRRGRSGIVWSRAGWEARRSPRTFPAGWRCGIRRSWISGCGCWRAGPVDDCRVCDGSEAGRRQRRGQRGKVVNVDRSRMSVVERAMQVRRVTPIDTDPCFSFSLAHVKGDSRQTGDFFGGRRRA